MNAPIIFVLIPILVGGLLILIPRRPLLSSLLASGVCLLLALLAGFLPMDQAIILGTSRITIASSLDILGRQIILNQESLGAVILIFAIGAFWFLGIRPASAPRRAGTSADRSLTPARRERSQLKTQAAALLSSSSMPATIAAADGKRSAGFFASKPSSNGCRCARFCGRRGTGELACM